jgi:hypothetical protein
MVSFTAEGNIPSGAPSGGAAVLFAGVREYFVYAMIFLNYNFTLYNIDYAKKLYCCFVNSFR